MERIYDREKNLSEIAKESYFSEGDLEECVIKILHLLESDLLNLNPGDFMNAGESKRIQEVKPENPKNCFDFVEILTTCTKGTCEFDITIAIGLKESKHFEGGALARLVFEGSYFDAIEWARSSLAHDECLEGFKTMLSKLIYHNQRWV